MGTEISLTMQPTIAEVERAVEDLRRGLPVVLVRAGAKEIIAAGEYHETQHAITDAAHPAVRLLKTGGLLPSAAVLESYPREGLLEVREEAIAAYPMELVHALRRVSEADVPLAGANSTHVIAYRPRLGHEEHLAIIIGNPSETKAPLVRLHSACVTGDIFGSLRCDCGGQLQAAIEQMAGEGAGVLLYLSQEGRGIGIASKLRAYQLQDSGMDTVEANEALGFAADERDFAIAAAMLKDLNVTRIRLLTNNPRKVEAMNAGGIAVAERVALRIAPGEHNQAYIDAKTRKLGHLP